MCVSVCSPIRDPSANVCMRHDNRSVYFIEFIASLYQFRSARDARDGIEKSFHVRRGISSCVRNTSCTILILIADDLRAHFPCSESDLQGSYISLSSSSISIQTSLCVDVDPCVYSFWSMPEYGIPKCTIQFNYFNVYAIAIRFECAIWLNKYNCVWGTAHASGSDV